MAAESSTNSDEEAVFLIWITEPVQTSVREARS